MWFLSKPFLSVNAGEDTDHQTASGVHTGLEVERRVPYVYDPLASKTYSHRNSRRIRSRMWR
jgi:hypothetical protein